MKLEQRSKIYGIIGTVIFHTALLLLLLCLSLSRIVPEAEEGLAVSLGVDIEGGNDFFEPSPASEIEGALATVTPTSTTAETEEFQTQDIEESVSMPVKKEKTKEEIKREKEQQEIKRQQEQQRQEELKKAAEVKALQEAQNKKAKEIGDKAKNLFGGNGSGGTGNSNSSSGNGTGKGSGNQGNPFGNSSASGSEGNSTNGTGGDSWSLAGRSLVGQLTKPNYNVYEEGKIVVNIIVNKEGTVINADIGRGTNIDNPILRKAAIEAAIKTKFNSINTEKNQSGIISYTFKLQ